MTDTTQFFVASWAAAAFFTGSVPWLRSAWCRNMQPERSHLASHDRHERQSSSRLAASRISQCVHSASPVLDQQAHTQATSADQPMWVVPNPAPQPQIPTIRDEIAIAVPPIAVPQRQPILGATSDSLNTTGQESDHTASPPSVIDHFDLAAADTLNPDIPEGVAQQLKLSSVPPIAADEYSTISPDHTRIAGRSEQRPGQGEPNDFVLDISDGRQLAISRAAVLGRRPQPRRATSNVVTLQDPQAHISKSHAVLGRQGDNFWVVDLGSTNGTWVHRANGELFRCRPAQRVKICLGDVVEIGELRICPRLSSNEDRDAFQ